ncbi:MAG: D-alanine--D-alanine ligase [Bdellovibrionota bacterium]
MKTKKIVLLQGGMGAERDVSLVTAKGFAQALVELGYPHEVLDAGPDLVEKLGALKRQGKVDVVLIALHGKYAEDGTVQGICEYLKVPYSGTGVLGSALCMDKILTKQILINNGVPTAEYFLVDTKKVDLKTVPLPNMGWPVVVKPSREGSSVGVSIVKTPADFPAALTNAAKYDHMILVEKFIAGMELTVPIFDGKVMTPIEIVPKMDFYTYENKYTAGATDYYLPARTSVQVIEQAKKHALKAFEVCRLRCYGRIDFRVSESGQPYVMEINTLPGCTPTSLLPKAAKHDGISFTQLIDTLIERATLDYEGLV